MAIVRHDAAIGFWCSGVIAPFTFAGWWVGIHWAYYIPHDARLLTAMKLALLQTIFNWHILLPTIGGLLIGIVVFLLLFTLLKTNFNGAHFTYFLRGSRLCSEWMLRLHTFEFKKQLLIGKVRVPSDAKNLHFSVTGSTGGGKSQAIGSMIASVIETSRVACIDPNGTYMSHFYKNGDIILNPFDKRTKTWTIFNEIRTAADCEHYAVCIIPKSPSTEQEQWNRMARVIVSETLLRLKTKGEGTTNRLTYWLTAATNVQLAVFLANSPAAGMFHGADETLGSVRTVLTAYVKPHSYMPESQDGNSFSFRDWIENQSGNLWITWREQERQALLPLLSCWTDVIAASILSTFPKTDLMFAVDELDSMQKLNYLLDLATKGRKHRLMLVAGIQSLAQLDEHYGVKDALTLRNSLRTIVTFGISGLDTYTAEELSKAMGEHEVVRKNSESGLGGRSQSTAVRERLVMPSELQGLPNLTGYLKFPNELPAAQIVLPYTSRKVVTAPFEEGSTEWTVNIADFKTLGTPGAVV